MQKFNMKRSSTVFLIFLMLSVLLFQGCLLDVTSVVGPGSTTTGKVITLTVNAMATSDGTNHYGGLILQIPNGTSVLRVHYQTSNGPSDFMIETPAITAGYVAEAGYHFYGALAPYSGDSDTVITFKVWLAVPNGVAPGTYTIKAAVGGYTGSVWVPQNPKAAGSAVLDFSRISGNYVSNAIVISPAGATVNVAPADVTPAVSELDSIHVAISTYDEAAQGDVAKYRVYLSKALFSATAGGQLLDNTTVPSVTGTNSSNVNFSTDIGAGLSYFEIPPGSEYPFWLNGLSWNAYYLGITAVDLFGLESNPVVVRVAERGSITGSLTDGINPVTSVGVTAYDSNCNNWINFSGSDGIGNYTVVLPVGNYKVLFDGTNNGYVSEWYNNKADCASADVVPVTALNVTNIGVTTLAILPNYTLTITKTGVGTGTVTSSRAGIDCGGICSAPYASTTAVTLTATAAVNSTFAGWSGGGCSGTGTCSVTMNADTAITANFAPKCTYTLKPASKAFTSIKGFVLVDVSATGNSCTLNPTESYDWINAAMSGKFTQNKTTKRWSGKVKIDVTENKSSAARTGTVDISGKAFTVTQSGAPCTVTISPATTPSPLTGAGATGSFTVKAPEGCNWTAASANTAWLTITSGSSGTGNGTVNYTASENTTGKSRTGKINVATSDKKSKKVFTVVQKKK